MNSINSIHFQQNGQVARNNAIRDAAKSEEMPKLTRDETNLIEKKFKPGKSMQMYSVNGDIKESQFNRGRNIDTRI